MAPDPTPPTEAERLRDNLLAIVATKEHLTVDGIVEFHGRLVAPVAAALDALLAAVRREERERCAKLVDGWAEDEPTCCKSEQTRIAAALRASQEGENG